MYCLNALTLIVIFSAPFYNMLALKFKTWQTIAFLASINHLLKWEPTNFEKMGIEIYLVTTVQLFTCWSKLLFPDPLKRLISFHQENFSFRFDHAHNNYTAWLCLFKTNIQPFRFKRPCLSILKEKLFLKSGFKK